MKIQNQTRIRFRFDEAKATQVAMLLLQRSGNRMSHLALMKLLYIIDREALCRWERPVIGGRYCSMQFGTVISQVLTKMRSVDGIDEPTIWTRHLEKVGNEMRLVLPEHVADLSPAETSLVEEVFDKFGRIDKFDLCNLTHSFGEWEDVGKRSKIIRIERVLAEMGKSEEDIHRVAEEVGHLNQVDELIGV